MIEAQSLGFIDILPFVLLGAGAAISFIMNAKYNSAILVYTPIGFGVFLSMFIVFTILVPINTEYQELVQTDIDNATCKDLPLMYEHYRGFKEKIKSKYIFDCVAEKNILMNEEFDKIKTDIDWLK